MADVSIGNIVATLRADASEFQRGIAAALQSLAQFQQAMQQQTGAASQGLNASLQQMGAALSGVQHSQATATQSTQQLTQALTHLSQTAHQGQQAAQQFGSMWQTALGVASGIGLATTIQGIVRSFANLATESVQLAAHMQDLHRTFTAIEGSGGTANRTMEELFQTAQRLGISFTGAVEGFKRLEAGAQGTTLSHENLLQVFNKFSSGARAMGLSTQQIHSALVAFEQMLTKGKLSAEELVKQLGNAVPGGLEKMAHGLGITTERLRAMAEASVIPPTIAIAGISEEMGRLGDKAGAIDNLSATFDRLKNETDAWKASLGSVLGEVIKPILDDVIALSKELRELMGIRPPGQQATPGANQGNLFSRFLPFSATTLGMPAPGTYGPTEQPGAPYVRPGGLPIAPSRFTPLIEKYAAQTQLDPGLLSQLIRVESGFNPAPPRGKAGEEGLGQITPGTAEMLQPGITPQQLRDPETNIRLTATYLSRLLKSLKDFDDKEMLALASYNAGPKKVADLLEQAAKQGRPESYAGIQGQLPAITQKYVPNVLNAVTTPTAAPGGADSMLPDLWTKQAGEALKQFERLKEEVQALAAGTGNVGGILNRDIAQRADQIVQKFAKIQEFMIAFPREAAGMSEELQQQVQDKTKEAAVLQASLLTETQRLDLLRQQVEKVEQLEIRRRAELVTMRQGQEEGERYSRLATAALQQTRIDEKPTLAGLTIKQQTAEYENRLVAAQNKASAIGDQVAAQRAEQMRPALEAEIARMEAFISKPQQSLADQASTQVEVQAAKIRQTIDKMLRELAQNPGLQAFAERLQNILQQVGTDADPGAAVLENMQRAYERVAAQMRERVTGIGNQIEQLGDRIEGAGLSPLDAALARIRREFEGMAASLDKLQEKLEDIQGATPEEAARILTAQVAIVAARARMPEARQREEGNVQFRAQDQSLEQLQARLDQLRTPQSLFGVSGENPAQQRELDIAMQGRPEGRQHADELRAAIREQERLNYVTGIFDQLGQSVAQSWSGVLAAIFAPAEHVDQAQLGAVQERLAAARERLNVVGAGQSQANAKLSREQQIASDKTLQNARDTVSALEQQRDALSHVESGANRVAAAFRAMGQNLLQTMSQIAAQESFRALFRLGAGILTGALVGGATQGVSTESGLIYQGPTSGGAPVNPPPLMFQHGGVVNHPTSAILGENPAMNPEYVLNRPQMQALMGSASRAMTAAGTQAAQAVTIINVSSQADAEKQRAEQEAMGKKVIVNTILADLSSGEGSRINRMIRTLQR